MEQTYNLHFCRHDEARRIIRIDLHVPRHQAHVFGPKPERKVTKFLVGQCLNGRCVDTPRSPTHGQGNGVLGHNCLSGRRVCGYKYRLQ